jgi:beta-1,4-mannooligosaccharide/beta-1,4-mannosyl-N-acetylglucosamine phosphorylase
VTWSGATCVQFWRSFPCAALTGAPTGRIAIYYDAADTVTGLAFGYVDEILAYLKDNSEV